MINGEHRCRQQEEAEEGEELSLLALAGLGAFVLITDFLFSFTLAAMMGGLSVVAVALRWYGLPLYSRRHEQRSGF